ncbi:ABC transporter substrate-binding protein [Aliarcobacter cryaerophilus]|uniref:ABC transporter substrate-binding protein n=1 Tax=Aliarcobacter cryaerophilus TaxID=28198 RepID=UPI0021B1D6EB|nr:ABC transporter substrate-binding protein [Aliarcobacter cryaerophilus]MCT7504666.1 ABC transporter substrate-binding protein [Aliarcobacter cryaerophilus]
MRLFLNLKLLFLVIFLNIDLYSKDLTKVTIQLSWFDQFQFAGYYMAKEQGFYKDAGLDVEILSFSFGLNIPKMVNDGDVDFAIGRENLILEKAKYPKIIALAAIFQATPLVLLTTKDSGIDTFKKFENKKLMRTKDDGSEVSLKAMLSASKIDLKSITQVEYSHNIYDLIEKRVDIISAYTSKAPYILQKEQIKYNIFYPKDYGFDMYSDFLITNIDKYNNDYNVVEKFKKASLKGWEYAYSNIEKSVDIIFEKYNTQNLSKDELIFEANELKKLSYLNNNKLGDMKEEKVKRIYDLYNVMGYINSEFKIDNFIGYDKKSRLEKWLYSKFEEHFNLAFLWKLILIIFIITAIFVYRQYLITKLNKRLKNLVNIKTYRLKLMNKKLATRIKKEIEKHQEKDRILAQQQKMVSMGQMIENIAHQWRQPLSVISTSASGLKLKKQLNILEDEELIKSIDQIVDTAKYLSDTIDDFRYFFKPQKDKTKFSLVKNIEKSLSFLETALKENSIEVKFDYEDIDIIAYETELMQVFINIINNSKDAFIEKKIKDRVIFISIKNFPNRILIEIKDNAGGVEDDILDKVFEPYFTTKHQYSGTGIGLYMSNQIIKTHLNGDIFMKNCSFKYKNIEQKGVITTIVLVKNILEEIKN